MSFWTDLEKGALQVIKTVAPTIAATAAGPFAPLVLPLMQKIFGTTDAAAVNSALTNATPEQLVALKQADAQLQEQLAALGVQRDKLRYDDTSDARKMNIETRQKTPAQLAWVIVIGFFASALVEIVGMIWFPEQWAKIPRDAIALLGMITGFVGNEVKQVAAFYFGSSADSQDKTQTLSEIAKS